MIVFQYTGFQVGKVGDTQTTTNKFIKGKVSSFMKTIFFEEE